MGSRLVIEPAAAGAGAALVVQVNHAGQARGRDGGDAVPLRQAHGTVIAQGEVVAGVLLLDPVVSSGAVVLVYLHSAADVAAVVARAGC